jgi:hypothetical protein
MELAGRVVLPGTDNNRMGTVVDIRRLPDKHNDRIFVNKKDLRLAIAYLQLVLSQRGLYPEEEKTLEDAVGILNDQLAKMRQ